MFSEIFQAFILIFVAEMGDKTQILAMAFATQYPVKKVLLGILLGAFLNHGIAVMLGSFIAEYVPINSIQIVAGIAFIGFALWTLLAAEDDEDENKTVRFGPVMTVALAFFIGELGDKTQLTAITLATDALYPLAILAGTVTGMVFTGGLGIIVGKKLGDKIPEFTIKLVAASVFMLFGVTKLYQTLPGTMTTPVNILVFALLMGLSVYLILNPQLKARRAGFESPYRRYARELHDYYSRLAVAVDEICLGEDTCAVCQGRRCLVGYLKLLIRKELDPGDDTELGNFQASEETLRKSFDRDKVIEILRLTLTLLRKDKAFLAYEHLNRIRNNLEIILFGAPVETLDGWPGYKKQLEAMDKSTASKVLKGILH